ncbi:hypothetical protein [Sneathiella sp.]|jgi:hypothetical protein|uniref:hypothetical protein n=1 Tax=Sneathiella sp. TaxID=1964365 RepID=UPI0039E6D9AB
MNETYFKIHLMNSSGGGFPASLMEAIDQVTVDQSDQAPQTFQITFSDDYSLSNFQNISVVSASELQIGKRLKIGASVGSESRLLMDGVITNVSYQPPTDHSVGQYIVSGEDISYFMDIIDKSMEYPFCLDVAIVTAILAPYLALGILPHISETIAGLLDIFTTPQQMGTDRQTLNQLASSHAFIFCIRPNDLLGQTSAYWGPPPYDDPLQDPLVVGYSANGNVAEIKFGFDGTKPTRTWALVENKETGIPIPIATLTSTSMRDFSAHPALTSSAVLTAKNKAIYQQGMGIAQAWSRAQAQTNCTADSAVTASGKVDALRYGQIMRAPGVIPVAGAGTLYDGKYYLNAVTHTLSRTQYQQEFSLRRDGIGTTLSSVKVPA